MHAYVRSKTYEDSRKVVEYNSTFNTDSKLEFNILTGIFNTILKSLIFCKKLEIPYQPDKRYLSLRDTLLTFSVELPEEVVPDNLLASTLFENLA